MLDGLAAALEHFLTNYGYIAIFVLMFVEEAGLPLPLPNEVALMYVGYLSSKGDLNPNLAGLVATLGATAGSGLLYTIARRGGRPLLRRLSRVIHIKEERLDDAERWVARHGPISVPIARLTPGLRIYTTVIAGILRVPYKVVVAAVFGASLIWSYFWVHLGRALGDRWEEGAHAFERAGRWGIGIVVVAVVVFFVARWQWGRRQVRRKAREDAAGSPDDEPEPSTPAREPVPIGSRSSSPDSQAREIGPAIPADEDEISH
ncbi:MAG: DedA family protein [Thermomicrobiales bacterium]